MYPIIVSYINNTLEKSCIIYSEDTFLINTELYNISSFIMPKIYYAHFVIT